MPKPLPRFCRKPGLALLILTCLAALLLFPFLIIHNGFNNAQQLLDEFVAYSGLGRLAALNLSANDGNWQPQKIAAAAAETVSPEPEPASPAKASSTTTLAPEPVMPLHRVVYSWPEAGKMVALTFDDGPSGQFTPQYLKVLNEYGVHATFFLIGRNVQDNPGLAAMIAQDGNELGNHTFDHHNLKQMDPATAAQEIASAQQLIEQDSHEQDYLFRPPGGNLNQSLVKTIDEMGFRVILWNIDPRDWEKSANEKKIIDNVLTNLQPGSIILLHEGKKHTLQALPALIESIRQRGYRLVTISELLATYSTTQPEPQTPPQQPQPPQKHADLSPQQPPVQPEVHSQSQPQHSGVPLSPLITTLSDPVPQNTPNPTPQTAQ